jgi:hypothetical protein
VRLVTPFLDPRAIACCGVPDPAKRAVRALAREFGLPDVPKRPTLFPATELPTGPRARLPGECSDSRAACLSFTTGLLIEAMEEYARCAALRE